VRMLNTMTHNRNISFDPELAKSQREARGTIIHKKNVENDNEECRKWGYILIIYGVAVFTNVIIVFSAGAVLEEPALKYYLSFFTDIWFLLPLALTIIAGMTILWVCHRRVMNRCSDHATARMQSLV